MKSFFLRVDLIINLVFLVSARAPLSVRLGSIFMDITEEESNTKETSFRKSVESFNENDLILPNTRLDVDMQYTKLDQFDAYQRACHEMDINAMSLFGSTPPLIDRNVASVSSALHIPYFSTTKFPTEGKRDNLFTIRLGPQVIHLVEAVKDLVKELDWENVAYVSHRRTGSLDGQLLVETLQNSGIHVHVLELATNDIRPDLVRLRNRGVQNYVIDLGAALVDDFFRQAMQSGIVHYKSNFIMTDLDFSSVNFNDVTHTGSNILGFSVTSKKSIEAKVLQNVITKELGSLLMESHEAALLYDGIQLFALAIETISNGTQDLVTPKVSCKDRDAPYHVGIELMNVLQQIKLPHSLSKQNAFFKAENENENQREEEKFFLMQSQIEGGGLMRKNIVLDIIKLEKSTGQRVEVGRWSWDTSSTRIELLEGYKIFSRKEKENSDANTRGVFKLDDRAASLTIQVWELQNTNFFRMKKNNKTEYEGFLVDLLDFFKRDMGYNFFRLRFSNSKGHLEEHSGNWTGVIGEIVNRNADLGVSDFTMTTDRFNVVDFSVPFDTSTLTILKRTSATETTTTVSPWLSPLPSSTWISILVAFILTSLTLFIVGRISPYERRSSLNPSCFGDGLSLCNSFWFALTGFFFRATSISPKSFGARFLTAIWWMFCLFVVVEYFSNLLPNIIKSKHNFHYANRNNNLDLTHLLHDDKTQFGAVRNMATWNMLKNSEDPVHQKIFTKIDPNLDLRSMSQALDQVLADENFGLVVESSQAVKSLQEKCGQITTAGELGQKYYGLIFPKGSQLTDKFSKAILKYEEDGTLNRIKKKWFGDFPSQSCVRINSGENSLTKHHETYSAPFLLLLISGLCALLISFLELLWYAFCASRKEEKKNNIIGPVMSRNSSTRGFWAILKEEMRNSVHCGKPLPQTQQNLTLNASSPTSGKLLNSNSNFLYKEQQQPQIMNNKNETSKFLRQTEALLTSKEFADNEENSHL